MNAIKRNFVVCITVCATLFLLSAGFPQIPLISATTSTNSIVAYGVEAQIFASMLSTEWSDLDFVLDNQPPVIVVSDISAVNLQGILDSMKNGAVLVAINLPVDNGLVDAPRYSFGSTKRIGLWTVTTETWQDVVPPYWIVVTKQTTPSLTASYVGGTAEDEQSHGHVMQMALEGVNSALFPDADYSNSSKVVVDGNWEKRDNEVKVVWPILSIISLVVLVIAVLLVGVIIVVVLLLRRPSKDLECCSMQADESCSVIAT